MSAKLSPKQALAMYYLLFTQEQPKQSEMQPDLKPKERKELVNAGLITLSKKGRAQYVSLTDRAWGWAEENLGCEVSTRSPAAAAKTLRCALATLGKYTQSQNIRLLELVASPTRFGVETDRIRAAYMKIADGQLNRPIRISDLSDALGETSSEALIGELLKLQAAREVFFSRGDDPQSISDRDRRFSAWIDNTQMHLIAFTK